MGVKTLEVMDTTLRDGEQSRGKTYSPRQKLRVTKFMLQELGVNRIEVASVVASKTEHQMLGQVMEWAKENGFEDQIEVLGFVDNNKSVNWLTSAGCQAMNLLCKGSEKHCHEQLKRTLQQHLADITRTVEYAVSQGVTVRVYLEDWSQGMINSPDYVEGLLAELAKLSIERVMLCDTLGVLDPDQTAAFVKQMVEWQPSLLYDFHGHNDYGLATANSLAAVKTGKIKAVHCTINGLGERAGNAVLSQMVVCINDFSNGFITTIDETKLRPQARYVAIMSGRRVPDNAPIDGDDVFANVAGVHGDGDRKGKLYHHPRLKAERFGATLEHPMGKLSGKSNIILNAEKLGLSLTKDEAKIVTARIVELAEEGKEVTLADLPYIVAEVLERPEFICFKVKDASSTSTMGKRAVTSATIKFRDKEYEISGHGDGGFDAFMCALRKWAQRRKSVVIPTLVDYKMDIPPGGTSAALVQVTITWNSKDGESEFKTIGVHCDQVLAAIEAAESAMNICNQNHK